MKNEFIDKIKGTQLRDENARMTASVHSLIFGSKLDLFLLLFCLLLPICGLKINNNYPPLIILYF